MAAPEGQISMTDPEGIGLVVLVALIFLFIRLLPRFIAGWRATINPLSLKRMLDAQNKKIVLLDVRPPDEFHSIQGHIPNAINIPLHELLHQVEHDSELQALKPHRIILICQTGGRAAIAVRLLRQRAFYGALLLEGGMRAWLAEELPVVLSEQARSEMR
jgi:rhodanese-related sulfurtransferase